MTVAAVGQPLIRKDGHAKVTGAAKYSADWPVEKVHYGVIFESAIASGKVLGFDIEDAGKVPGVVEIITYKNAPSLHSIPSQLRMSLGDPQLPLQNNRIYYNGQPLGVVVAQTLEAAEQAAQLVKMRYQSDIALLNFEEIRKSSAKTVKKDVAGRKATDRKGDVEAQIKKSAQVVSATYTTPIENHHPIETHSTVAIWTGKQLKVYDATQGVANLGKLLSEAFKVSADNMQVISKFIGGGFGSKGSAWTHIFIAVMAAKVTQVPVKIVITRNQMSTNIGYRANSIQNVTLGSDQNGKLLAIKHETVNPTSIKKDFLEPAGSLFKMMYAAPAIATTQKVVNLNYPGPTFMRAPGECPGSFALESAMDELAAVLKLDPIEIRLRNYAENDPMKDVPFSSKSLRECYRLGAEKFGWSRYKIKPGTERHGDSYVGYGMASGSYPVHFFPAQAKVELLNDGTAKVVSATQDIGTGTYTVMTQLAADALGLPYEKVTFDLGDSHYPAAGPSGGSSTVSSVGWAIADASQNLLNQLKKIASQDRASALFNLKSEQITARDASLIDVNDSSRSETYVELLRRNNKTSLVAAGKMNEKQQKENESKFSQHAYGAHFAEVRVHHLTGEVTLVKMVGAFAAGKIVNPKTARSQFMGGMIFGIGMGLTEQNIVDERSGKFMLRDLAEYHVPVNKDVPEIEIVFVEEKDSIVNPAGTKGIGEIGNVGSAAAIANAVFNATGIRIRDLPITPDKLAIELHKRS